NVPLRANDVRGAAGFSKPEAGDEIVSQQRQSQPNQDQEDEESGSQDDEEGPVSFEGVGILPYGKSRWIRIDEKGNRKGWSSAQERPKGSGWQAYTTPNRKSDQGEKDSANQKSQSEPHNEQTREVEPKNVEPSKEPGIRDQP